VATVQCLFAIRHMRRFFHRRRFENLGPGKPVDGATMNLSEATAIVESLAGGIGRAGWAGSYS
jgi:hypothetical protein